MSSIHWEFLDAKYKCEIKGKTIHVYLQQDISLFVNQDISVKLPIKFKIKSGAVLIDTFNKKLTPVNQAFLLNCEEDGLRVTFYNRSNQSIDMKSGEILCIMRHVN